MALQRTDQLDFPQPPQAVFNAVGAALQQEFGAVNQVDPTTLAAQTSTSMRSWGERITASIQPGPNGSSVTITSKSGFPLQVIDWGKHRKNLNLIATAIRRNLGE